MCAPDQPSQLYDGDRILLSDQLEQSTIPLRQADAAGIAPLLSSLLPASNQLIYLKGRAHPFSFLSVLYLLSLEFLSFFSFSLSLSLSLSLSTLCTDFVPAPALAIALLLPGS